MLKTIKLRSHLLPLCIGLMSTSVIAQQASTDACNISEITETDIEINNDGTFTHLSTGLTWYRCYAGQEIVDGKCTSTDGPENVDLTYPEAFRKAESADYAGYSDWRMPNIKELYSLISFRCNPPSDEMHAVSPPGAFLEGILFPLSTVWTATPAADGGQSSYSMVIGAFGAGIGYIRNEVIDGQIVWNEVQILLVRDTD